MVRTTANNFCEKMGSPASAWDLKGDEQIHIFADGSVEVIHPSRPTIYPRFLPFVREQIKKVFYTSTVPKPRYNKW